MARIPVVVDLDSEAAERGVANLKSQLGGLGPALAAGAVAGGVLAIGKAGFDAALEIGQLADAALTTTDRIQELQFIADRTGGSIDALADGQRELQIRLGELVAHGAGPAKDALDSLGISMEDLADKSPEEQMDFLIQRLLEVENTSERVFLAEELLGGQFAENARVLGLTAEEYQNLSIEAGNYNKVSEENIRSLEESNEQFKLLQTSLTNAVIPVLADLSSGLLTLTDSIGLTNSAVMKSAQELEVTSSEYEDLRLAVKEAGVENDSFFGKLGSYLTTGKDWQEITDEVNSSIEEQVEELLRARNATSDVSDQLDLAVESQEHFNLSINEGAEAALEAARDNLTYAQSLQRVTQDALSAGAAINGLYSAQQRIDLATGGFSDVVTSAANAPVVPTFQRADVSSDGTVQPVIIEVRTDGTQVVEQVNSGIQVGDLNIIGP